MKSENVGQRSGIFSDMFCLQADHNIEADTLWDTDANGGVTRFCIRRYNTANTYPWEDPWESDSNSFNRKGHWKGNTVYFRIQNKKFQDKENKKFYLENKERNNRYN